MRASWSFLEQQHIQRIILWSCSHVRLSSCLLNMISYAKVTIQSQFQVWMINFVENQQTLISVIEAIAIYHNIGKSQYKSFSASPHTQLSYSLSQFLTLTQYLWVWSFNRTQRKIGAYSFASQRFTSRVMSTIIVHENSHPISYIYIRIFPTRCACQRIKCKKERWRSPWLLYKVEDKSKR